MVASAVPEMAVALYSLSSSYAAAVAVEAVSVSKI